jgi:uncharacterized Tic20 family protein
MSDPTPSLPPAPRPDRTWEVACHVSAFAGLLAPGIGNVVGPLVVWLLKKAENPAVDRHGRESLNFQISMSIYAFVGSFACGIIAFLTCGIGIFLIYAVAIAFYIANIAMPILGALRASEGGFYEYPFNLRLIK